MLYYPTVSLVNFVNISEQKESSRDGRRDTWCVTSEVEYFRWLKKQPVNQVLSSERTKIYSKVVMCGCPSFYKPVKSPVLYCAISLYICTHYWDVAMRYLHVTKGVG